MLRIAYASTSYAPTARIRAWETSRAIRWFSSSSRSEAGALQNDISLSFRTQKEQQIAVLNLAFLQDKNAVSTPFLQGILRQVEEVNKSPDARVLFLQSTHPKIFCAGANLKERLGMSKTEILSFLDLFRSALKSLEEVKVPTFALIEGAALGGGLELALACDFRVGKVFDDPSQFKSTVIGLPETKLAIIPGAGGTQRLSRLIGPAKAKDLIFTGRRLDIKEAHEIGIIDYLADESQSVTEKALQVASTMLSAGPIAVKAAKGAINEGMEMGDLDDALDVERKFYETVLDTHDRVEGLKAFAEKRTPLYQGN